jgi:hypothetical protein
MENERWEVDETDSGSCVMTRCREYGTETRVSLPEIYYMKRTGWLPDLCNQSLNAERKTDARSYFMYFCVHHMRPCLSNCRKFKRLVAEKRGRCVNSESRKTSTQKETQRRDKKEQERIKTIKINKIEKREE